jgi:hypothetical protein
MTHLTFQFDFKDLDVDLKQIESILGYGEGDDREIVNSLIEEFINEPELFRNIRAEYKIYENIEFVDTDKSLSINNINFQIHKIVFRQLKKADSFAVFLCTAGAEIGRRSREAMQNGDPLKGYILDVVGSIVVDSAADLLQDDIRKSVILSGKKITNRYSPGYCGWYVGEQHKLFQLLPDNFCGIRLTESALMDPIKSISGIIGIGENIKYNNYTCRLCDMKDCVYRRVADEKKTKWHNYTIPDRFKG